VAEQGTHEELLAHNGIYRRVYELQGSAAKRREARRMRDGESTGRSSGFDWAVWKKLGPFLRPYRGKLLTVILLMILTSLCDLANPLLLRRAIDRFIVPGQLDGLWGYALAYLGVITFLHALRRRVLHGGHRRGDVRRARPQARAVQASADAQPGLLQHDARGAHPRPRDERHRQDRLDRRVEHGGHRVELSLRGGRVRCHGGAERWPRAARALHRAAHRGLRPSYFQRRILAVNRDIRAANSRITGAFNEGIGGARTSKVLVIERENEKEFSTPDRRHVPRKREIGDAQRRLRAADAGVRRGGGVHRRGKGRRHGAAPARWISARCPRSSPIRWAFSSRSSSWPASLRTLSPCRRPSSA
jgi:hypothetical protein